MSECMFLFLPVSAEWSFSCLLDAEAEVEDAVRWVLLSVWSFHLRDEAAESVAQLGGGASEEILLQLDGPSWDRHETSVK